MRRRTRSAALMAAVATCVPSPVEAGAGLVREWQARVRCSDAMANDAPEES